MIHHSRHILSLCALLSLGLLAGCNNQYVRSDAENQQRQTQITPTLTTVSAGDVTGRSALVELPQNYDPSNYKKHVVAVSFYPADDTEAGRFAAEKSEVASSLFETEMSKIKRFTIVSRSQLGQQAIRDEKRFQDTGLVQADDLMRLGQMKGADYALAGGIAITSESYERLKNQEMLLYVTVNYQLVNIQTGEIEEADTAIGRAKRTFYQTPSGAYVGGFNINDAEQRKEVIKEASFQALKIIANKLGNKLPVGGSVVGLKGNLFQIDAGYDQGLMGDQIVVLYAWDGIDIPLAYGEISPGKNKAQGKVIKWSNAPEAQALISRMKTDGMAFLRETDTYAVSKGMPHPPEWNTNYSN